MATSPWRALMGELVGTFLLAFFGTGSVMVAVTTGALTGLLQVALVWALGIMIAIYLVAAASGAHLNPAVTLAMAARRDFGWGRVVPYWIAQVIGAFLASAVLYLIYAGPLAEFERTNQIVRGAAGSEKSAMVFGEYFPNPAVFDASPHADHLLSTGQAMAAEALGTGLLVLVIFGVTDPRRKGGPGGAGLAPVIGLTVAAIIAIVAPLTQAGLNPARDFGPRLFSWLAGWGTIAIPGPRGGFFTVYILAPMLGALAAAFAYEFLAAPKEPEQAR